MEYYIINMHNIEPSVHFNHFLNFHHFLVGDKGGARWFEILVTKTKKGGWQLATKLSLWTPSYGYRIISFTTIVQCASIVPHKPQALSLSLSFYFYSKIKLNRGALRNQSNVLDGAFSERTYRLLTVQSFSKNFHFRCLTGFWIRL